MSAHYIQHVTVSKCFGPAAHAPRNAAPGWQIVWHMPDAGETARFWALRPILRQEWL
jgi:hypothetical protein